LSVVSCSLLQFLWFKHCQPAESWSAAETASPSVGAVSSE
jgi:hypothetical protein